MCKTKVMTSRQRFGESLRFYRRCSSSRIRDFDTSLFNTPQSAYSGPVPAGNLQRFEELWNGVDNGRLPVPPPLDLSHLGAAANPEKYRFAHGLYETIVNSSLPKRTVISNLYGGTTSCPLLINPFSSQVEHQFQFSKESKS